MPKTAKDAPIRAQLLNAIEDPRCKKSRTEIEDPRRAQLRRETEDPRSV
jgi:hypothetical protein